jgi:hypothetical protein
MLTQLRLTSASTRILLASAIIVTAFACRLRLQENASVASTVASTATATAAPTARIDGCDTVDTKFIEETLSAVTRGVESGTTNSLDYMEWKFLSRTIAHCAQPIDLKIYCLEAESNRNSRITAIHERAKIGENMSAARLNLARDILTFRSICAASAN